MLFFRLVFLGITLSFVLLKQLNAQHFQQYQYLTGFQATRASETNTYFFPALAFEEFKKTRYIGLQTDFVFVMLDAYAGKNEPSVGPFGFTDNGSPLFFNSLSFRYGLGQPNDETQSAFIYGGFFDATFVNRVVDSPDTKGYTRYFSGLMAGWVRTSLDHHVFIKGGAGLNPFFLDTPYLWLETTLGKQFKEEWGFSVQLFAKSAGYDEFRPTTREEFTRRAYLWGIRLGFMRFI